MIESTFPILEVADMQRALAFYRDALGGVVVYSYPPDGEGEPVYVSLSTGATSMGIGLTESPLPPGNVMLWFYVDDVDRVTTHLTGHGANVIEGPVDQPWGERTALITDPFGTRLHLAAAISAPPDEE
ncbi:VOC family protein [Agromyces ramosus]|uniref:Glyoxalase superfamily protein PhnB n=1 Tax=Agromyces ramosus TaxID=33879 RepID=A0ABU0R890_9MICO|nr:glyoxalase superfamily protein [Agromyces ramosus]MDQ0894298.1 putative glyoxalase superfamily protein PhnB [Agromyces ramosus]